uniref:non-specific serine/threonine protein kinase n=1 Tax=Naja naja TaxID=35670 RepID=A0A8C7E4M0_NAJNA
MGSCDLATTFIGTPFYMSPEALQHQGYDTKSDIWSLGCILYEVCCLNHAFTGHSFLSVVLKIVESKTPSLPDNFPRELDAVLHRMLNKDPSLRPSAAEILRTSYIDDQLQHTNISIPIKKDWMFNSQEEADHLISAVKKKVHLQTLRTISEMQKMTPRERMRLRKLTLADQTAQKLKQLAEEKYQENLKRMQELRSRNFHQVNIDVLHMKAHLVEFMDKMIQNGHAELAPPLETDEECCKSQLRDVSLNNGLSVPVLVVSCIKIYCHSQIKSAFIAEIPEDPLTAEEYYNEAFDSCSETSEESDREQEEKNASQTVCKIYSQVYSLK